MTTYVMDTSVLVEHERGNRVVTDALKARASAGHRLAICEPVAMELLAGAWGQRSSTAAQLIVDGFPSLPLDGWRDFRSAGTLYQAVRRSGHTVRSLVDCLIAVVAMGSDDTVLLHVDRDFEAIAEVSDLRQERLAVV